MEKARLDGRELQYEVRGSGEPVLLIGTGPIADSFLPFLSQGALSERHRLIRYRQRGQVDGAPSAGPVSFSEHAADAAALLDHLGIGRAHVAGHSTGAAIALQLALDRPDRIRGLALLEPPLAAAESAGPFFDKIGPALAAYGEGDHEAAMARFLAVVSGLPWDRCRAVVESNVPGSVARALAGADTFFGSYLPALGGWPFGPAQAAALSPPVLSVVGSETEAWFREGHGLLRSWLPRVEACAVAGVGHLLHMQDPAPVARGVAEFFARWPIAPD